MYAAMYKALQDAGYDTEAIFTGGSNTTTQRKGDFSEFTQGLGFIVYFILLSLVLYMVAGEKPLRYFLYIVLLGMVLLNTDRFSDLLRRVKP